MERSRVILGRNGWLYRGYDIVAPSGPADWNIGFLAAHIRDINRRCSEYGVDNAVVIAPDKQEVLPEYYPEDAFRLEPPIPPHHNRSTDLQADVLHLARYDLQREVPDYWLFPKTDSTWSAYGAYCGSARVLAKLGIAEEVERASAKWQWYDEPFIGNLRRQQTRLAADRRRSFHGKAVTIFDNMLRGPGRIVIKTCPQSVAYDMRCAVIGNCFSDSAFFDVLAEVFGQTIFLYSPTFDYDFAISAGADVVVWQVAERSLPHLSAMSLKKLGGVFACATNAARMYSGNREHIVEYPLTRNTFVQCSVVVLNSAVVNLAKGQASIADQLWQSLVDSGVGPEYYAGWAIANAYFGRAVQAIDFLEQACRLAPENMNFASQLQQLKSALGDLCNGLAK